MHDATLCDVISQGKGCDCTTSVEKYLLNASVRVLCLCKVLTATSAMGGTLPPSARYPQVWIGVSLSSRHVLFSITSTVGPVAGGTNRTGSMSP